MVICLGQDVLELFVLSHNGAHRLVDGFSNIGAFLKVEKPGESRDFRSGTGHHTPVISFADGPPGCTFSFQFFLSHGELMVSVAKKDQSKNRN